MQEKKLFLLDAMALVYRAYYALIRSPRVTSQGKNTNAQFGFTNTLYELIKKEKPTHLAVVWDTNAPTERHNDFSDYKANRQETPEDLLLAIPDIKKIISGFRLPNIELDGYEADDVIGTIAWEAAKKNYLVYMVTPDKDYGQLVKENVHIYKPGYKGGVFEILGEKEICEKWDINNVQQVIDILGLMGDAVDNIPGIPGVGEKTAVKLLKQYHSLENILDNAEHIKGALGEKIRTNKEKAILSKKLATIITNVPIEFNENNYLIEDWDNVALQEIFGALEFRTLGNRILSSNGYTDSLPSTSGQHDLFTSQTIAQPVLEVAVQQDLFNTQQKVNNIETVEHDYHLINTTEALSDFLKKATNQKEIAIDTETTHLNAMLAELVGISFSWQAHQGFYIPCSTNKSEVHAILEELKTLFDNEQICWIGQNLKYDFLVLKNYGIEVKGKHFDTMIAHYTFEPDGKRNMDALSAKYLKYEPVSIERLIGKKGKQQANMRDVSLEQIKEYAAEDADVTYRLKQHFVPILKKENVEELFYKVDNPLVPVLTDMEFEGVGLDKEFLRNYSIALAEEINYSEENVYKQAGTRFNIASPKQLGEVLFDKMQLDDNAKKTKTGQYATGEDILNKIKHKHQIIDDILIFRELSKLKSTYADALPQMVHPITNRIHTSFNQALVITGRLSSNQPNLQNIPVKTAKGREIRKAFIARSSAHKLLSVDYSQIELRVVAAISGDEGMIEAFLQEKDIHRATAAKVYGIKESEVTTEMRRNAKAVNFGIIYGQSAFGLSQTLGISRSEAKNIIDSYFEQYKGVKKYMKETVENAKVKGYVQTLMGRKIKLADIRSANNTVRGFAERVAINAPIQGSAADMIKLAMIRIHQEMKKQNMTSKMILQVHDELIFDCPKEEIENIEKMVVSNMINAMSLPYDVPVLAEAGVGNNWDECK